MNKDKEKRHFWLVKVAGKNGIIGTLSINTSGKLIPWRTIKRCEKIKEEEIGFESALCETVSYLGFGTIEDFYSEDDSKDTFS